MTEFPKVFVAYPSHDSNLLELIRNAVKRANAKSKDIRYESWEYNDIAGRALISPILENISGSKFVVADITYLNLNVVYEIGYSIGSSKRVFLTRNSAISGDKEIARQAGIFDTLGYSPYADGEDLCHTLISYVDSKPISFEISADTKSPVYVIEPPVKGADAINLIARVKKARYRYRSFNPSEETRLSATDAIRQVARSAGIFITLYPETVEWAGVHNVRSMFVAGLAMGMAKPCLILSSQNCEVPLDVRDDVKIYQRPEDIGEHVLSFIPDIAEYLQRSDTKPINVTSSLQSLYIGDPTAENEMTTLSEYYLPTNECSRTLRGEVNLVVGRKGSGKTALFIQCRDEKRSDKRNIVVDLKPEGYQLIKLKEDILGYLTEGSRQHIITAFWEYLILLEVAYKLLEKDRSVHKHNHEIYDLYRQLESIYRSEESLAEGDFSERLLTLSTRISVDYKAKYGSADGQRLTTDQIAHLLYRHDVKELTERISKYLTKKQSVWVLFDNLDKGWSTGGVDVIDAIALRCLIDAGRKLERDMRKAGHRFHCIVFIRNDVYEHLMQHSSDYGKEMRATLDWSDPDLLKEMLRLRLVNGLNLPPETTFEKIWQSICVSHCQGEESSMYFIDRSLMRPRNVLKLFNFSRGFSNNFRHRIIEEKDIDKGSTVYSQDLLVELGHELNDVLPGSEDLLYYFMDAEREISAAEFEALLERARVDPADYQTAIDFLLYYGVVGLGVGDYELYIYNVNYDSKALRIRAELEGDNVRYVINPAFCQALGIQ